MARVLILNKKITTFSALEFVSLLRIDAPGDLTDVSFITVNGDVTVTITDRQEVEETIE